MDTHPNTSHPQILGEPVEIGAPHGKSKAATVVDSPTTLGTIHRGRGYTSSQPLPDLNDTPVFPIQQARRTSPFHGEAPVPYIWAPKFLPEQWVYTDGTDITSHPLLGAAVVRIPTNTIIYIDAKETKETRTIMRAELVAIHMALKTRHVLMVKALVLEPVDPGLILDGGFLEDHDFTTRHGRFGGRPP